MRDTLYLQLTEASADGLYPWARGGQPGLGTESQRGPLETILPSAAGRQLVLFVPGADVRLASIKVPARQPQKVLQAAPYALEEQFAEDVETLHFALGPRQPDGSHPVAVVARARMDAWLARFGSRRPDVVVPETLCLPLPETGQWTGLADGTRVTVRTGAYSGFACPLADLPTYLQIADPDAIHKLRLFVSRDTDFDFSTLKNPVELLPGSAHALEVLVRHWRADTAINLLQGSYSARKDWQGAWQPWRTAGAIAATWLVLALVLQGVQAFRLGREVSQQEAANLARFQQLFPQEKKIVDLAAQADQQLKALRSGGARAPLFQLLQLFSEALAANPGLSLQTLQFRDGALFLNLTGKDVQAYESLRGWFASRPEALLEVQSTNAGNDGLQIRLKLSLA